MLNFLCMGLGAFVWGALSDRLRHARGRPVRRRAAGARHGAGEPGDHAAAVPAPVRRRSSGWPPGSFYAPLIATTTRWFTEHRSLAVALVSAGLSVGSTMMAPLARWLITSYDWRTAMLGHRRSRVARDHPGRLPGAQPAGVGAAAAARGRRRARHDLTHRAGGAHAAVRRHRAHPLRVLRGALRADLPHGHPRDRSRGAGDGRRHRAERGRPRLAQRQDRAAGSSRTAWAPSAR